MMDTVRGEEGQLDRKRVVLVVVAVIAAVAVSALGPFSRIGSAPPPPEPREIGTTAVTSSKTPRALTYRELSLYPRGPNAGWQSRVQTLKFVIPAAATNQERKKYRKATLEVRASRRAYDGAPPTIPHPVRQKSSASCLACHADGVIIGTRRAPPIAHRPYQSCTQCHVRENNPHLSLGLEVDNTFTGIAVPEPRTRVSLDKRWSIMPHSTWMREICGACHGVLGAPGLRTSHPERPNCIGCHRPSVMLEAPSSRRVTDE